MKRFKKLLPIAAILVLVAALMVPATVLAAPMTNINLILSDNTPGATADYNIGFQTAAMLSACTPGVTYSQFNLHILGSPGLPASSATAYKLWTNVGGYGAARTYQSGDYPSGDDMYTVTVDDANDWVYIRYCHTSACGTGTGVQIIGVTNGASGSYPVFIYTRDQADTSTDVDTGVAGYMLRNPGEVVATVRGELVSVTVNPGGVNYDVLALGAVKNTAEFNPLDNTNGMGTPQTQNIQNNGTVPVDLQIMSSNALHVPGLGTTDWTLVETITDPEQYTHAYNVRTSVYGGGPITFTNWTAPDTYESLATNVPAGPPGNRYLELEIGMPTTTVDYNPHTMVVTIMATASP
jgi:hypothetical protein